MEAWRKGREFVRMLERKQQILQGDIVKAENRLAKLKVQITQYQQECADINQQIKMLTPNGVNSRADIYKGIRQQGALLAHQQQVMFKINQLESEQYDVEDNLLQYRSKMTMLDKKHHKLSYYLRPLRREYLRRSDNNTENEIQEIAGYGRKSY